MAGRLFRDWFIAQLHERDWTPAEAAQKLGVHPSTLSRWQNGLAWPERRTARLVVDVLGISKTELDAMIEADQAPERGPSVPDLSGFPSVTGAVVVPIITSVSAGGGFQHDGYEIVSPPEGASRHLAGFRVRGDCMGPAGIWDGDTVIVDLAAEWRDGNVVLARVGDDLLIKRAYHAGDRVRLHADGDGYEDTFDPSTTVLGVVVRTSREVR